MITVCLCVQVVFLASQMVYFGFYNFSKLLVLTRVLFDGLDAKSANTPGPSGGLFGGIGGEELVCVCVWIFSYRNN